MAFSIGGEGNNNNKKINLFIPAEVEARKKRGRGTCQSHKIICSHFAYQSCIRLGNKTNFPATDSSSVGDKLTSMATAKDPVKITSQPYSSQAVHALSCVCASEICGLSTLSESASRLSHSTFLRSELGWVLGGASREAHHHNWRPITESWLTASRGISGSCLRGVGGRGRTEGGGLKIDVGLRFNLIY